MINKVTLVQHCCLNLGEKEGVRGRGRRGSERKGERREVRGRGRGGSKGGEKRSLIDHTNP